MSLVTADPGTLYVVATPIGNRLDITERAIEILSQVDLIAAEDTRHSARLLGLLGITTPLTSFHDFSSVDRVKSLLERIRRGQSLALISDAGTPCISDPGYELVRAARIEGLAVIPVPGPSALVAALSVSGLPSDRFVFEGFLPARSGPRQARLRVLEEESRTLIFYESPHRIIECLEDMQEIMGPDRELLLGRELTKKFESTRLDSVAGCRRWVTEDAQQQKGEFVLVLAGKLKDDQQDERLQEGLRVLGLLTSELPLKAAVRLAAEISGARRNALYKAALEAGESDIS